MGNFNRGYYPGLQGKWLQAGITLCSAWAFTLFGYDQGVLGGLIALPSFLRDNKMDPKDADEQGTIVAIYDVGCFTGCIIMAFIGQKLGRRMYIVIGGLLIIMGGSLQAGSSSTAFLYAGRIIGGVGMGLNSTMVPIWVAETSKASSRGALIAAQLTVVILGVTIAYWFDYGMIKNYTGSIVWRLPIAFQVVYVILCFCMIGFLPESPRWLYANGHHADADDVMARIYCVPVDGQEVAWHRRDVLTALETEKEFKFKWTTLFYDESPLNVTWRLWLGVLVQFFQQMDGNNMVSYYATYLFINSLGYSQSKAALTAGGVTLVFFAGTATTIYTVERLGRKAVMFWGAILCSLFMILFTVGLAVNTESSLLLSVVSIFLFEFFFGASWCPLPWVYVPEIAPLHVRHIGTSMGVFTQWFVTFIVVKFGPMGIQQAGWKFYLLFCVFNVLAVFFVYFCVKETQGLSLEEIDVLFAKKEYKPLLQAKLRENQQRDEKLSQKSAEADAATLGNDEKRTATEHHESTEVKV